MTGVNSALFPKSATEKSSRRMTEAGGFARLGVTTEPRVGDDCRPSDGCLRAGDCRNVLIGDFDLGGGIVSLFLSVKTAVGSGIVPIIGKYVSMTIERMC